jgi:Tol biopolymer transport system component/DNA-binding winged helix-turn-helix (wHTH) protein
MDQREITHVYEFGGFRLDPRRRVLLRANGQPIALKPKVFDALLHLVEHAGEPLDKNTLIAAIWPNLVVEENNLNKTISVLRRVLGERPDDHKFIVTEPGRGYRFVATVSQRERDAEPGRSVAPRRVVRGASLRYAGIAALAAVTALAAASYFAQAPSPAPRPIRFQIETAKALNPLNIALSPDGEQIAYVGEGERGNALWIRSLGSLDARAVPGTEGIPETSYPFWSPDGREIAYRELRSLARIDVAGGLANSITDGVTFFRRGAWGADGTILYATEQTIYRVPAGGGESVAVTTLDPSVGETAHSAPQFLPDGKHFLYKATNVNWRKGAIYVGAVDSDEPPRRLLEASRAIYVDPGYIVYSKESSLFARRFDAARLELAGASVQLADDVFYRDSMDTSAFEVAARTLIYRAVPKDQAPLPLLWVNADGSTSAAAAPAPPRGDFRLSPDGRRILYDEGSPPDVWTLDLERGARTRITSDPQAERRAIWSPDGTSIVFDAHRDGGRAIYEKRADGALPEKLLLATGAHNVAVTDWSADGRFIIFERDCVGCDRDIWVLPRAEGAEPYAYAATQFDEYSAVLSPDGRWIAYVTMESGVCEVVVQSFADPTAGKWQVSANGGLAPRWSPDGRELYYFDGIASIVRVDVATEPTFSAGKPVRVSDASGARRWDVARGHRLLRTYGDSERVERSFPITVILNWTVLLED